MGAGFNMSIYDTHTHAQRTPCCIPKSDPLALLPAGQYLASGPPYRGRLMASGSLALRRRRWGGWSCSWLVPLRNKEVFRSKVRLPSGLGYSLGAACAAGASASWSGRLWKEGGSGRAC